MTECVEYKFTDTQRATLERRINLVEQMCDKPEFANVKSCAMGIILASQLPPNVLAAIRENIKSNRSHANTAPPIVVLRNFSVDLDSEKTKERLNALFIAAAHTPEGHIPGECHLNTHTTSDALLTSTTTQALHRDLGNKELIVTLACINGGRSDITTDIVHSSHAEEDQWSTDVPAEFVTPIALKTGDVVMFDDYQYLHARHNRTNAAVTDRWLVPNDAAGFMRLEDMSDWRDTIEQARQVASRASRIR